MAGERMVESLTNWAQPEKSGEPASVTTLFFPMHRIERIEIDAPISGLPSMGERFELSTGIRIEALIGIVSGSTVKQ